MQRNQISKMSLKKQSKPSDSNVTRLNASQEKLETFYEERTKGIIIRSLA